ncbi:OLC1v1011191C1 [Oldenlandia corymbosa var. corymbosa]|uniref:OLC1v1011191C1 n=1 Tax=Oldenlandia corymbosa var. corymbosa TaxID=529605 RepID=A0AAV1DT56_OLDCO|nr:OLC1v1011191C1 [Oldenlandia corymbosa var. corymbosa]
MPHGNHMRCLKGRRHTPNTELLAALLITLLKVGLQNLLSPHQHSTRFRSWEAGVFMVMGAYRDVDVFSSQSSDFVSSCQDLRFSKHVRDNVHGNIYLDPISLKFVDTEQFQRLRELKQLGMAHMVYPGAVHSRFEHSLGVYRLAGEAILKLKNNQGLELGIDNFDVQTVKLAGLLHDVGHGPFSHLFEKEFLPKVLNGYEWSHEKMSADMVDCIVDEHYIDIDSEKVKTVKEMILASSKFALPKSAKEKQFLYDIVANGRTSIDVDKFDYIVRDSRACGLGCNFQFERLMETMRVIDDEICYRSNDYLTIHKLFAARADMHRTVYTHAKVKAIELMVVDALVEANDYLDISSHIQDPREFWKLDDTIIKTIETAPDPNLQKSRDLILRIRRRNLYQFCNEYAVPKDKLEHFKDVTANDIVSSQKSGGLKFNEDDVVVSNVRIDLTRGKHNPLESVSFFKDFDSDEKFPIPDDRISHLLPTFYQDMIVRVYSKKPELVGAVSEAFENFQLKTYGIKTQVHATPEKKKRRI